MGHVVGVDGCRFGWIAVSGQGADVDYQLFRSMADLLAAHASASRVFVDIPIGLPWRECPTRPCDSLARRVLRHRHVSVFSAPSRPACHAAADKAEARRLNLEEVGHSLSEQALGICSKIAEVDRILRSDPRARLQLREVHPEVCFWSINGQAPIDAAKRTRAGLEQRIALLTARMPSAPGLLVRVLAEQRRYAVQADDVLDALVAYVTASGSSAELRALSGTPSHDREGLPMEMLYLVNR